MSKHVSMKTNYKLFLLSIATPLYVNSQPISNITHEIPSKQQKTKFLLTFQS